MGVFEAIAISRQMVWGVKKYEKAIKDTYSDILIRGSWKMVEISLALCLFSIGIIEPSFITQLLIDAQYSDAPHRMTAVTKFDFFETRAFMYISIIILYLYIKKAFGILSAMSGGYCIPKKP